MIEFTEIVKSFGAVTALDGLTLRVTEGELFGLLGPNGAGKSTLIAVAAGLLEPDSGRVRIGGNAADPMKARSNLGVAPQALALYDELTAAENLTFFGKLYRFSGAILRERVEWALAFSGLADRRNDRVSTYSGGMKRRLNLAAALLHDPEVLLLDEPTVGVDPHSRNSIFDSIETLHREGKTIVYTTHYMEEAQRLCDRVAIIDHGKVLAIDTVENLLKQHGGKCLLVAATPGGEERIETDDPVGELVRLRQAGVLHDFTIEKPDLESVFLNLTGRRLRD
jgi:ABC-2 type transport system ATP-binding protein